MSNPIISLSAVMLSLGVVVGVMVERLRRDLARKKWKHWRSSRGRSNGSKYTGQAKPYFDYKAQILAVREADFRSRALLNKSEKRLYSFIERELEQARPGWKLMAQVNLGEILTSKSKEAFRAINTKRVDMLVIDENSLPIEAIEYQGKGHHGKTSLERDAIKEQALSKAGIGYSEVYAGEKPTEVKQMLNRVIENRPEHSSQLSNS